jgi:hypothetical protein
MSSTEEPAYEVSSPFQKRPAYKYIRASDKLPTYAELPSGETATSEQVVCKVKLFNPTGAGTWWLAAYDPDTGVGWGVAEIHEREIGSFYMPELVEFRGRLGLPIERDLHWKPRTMAEVLGKSAAPAEQVGQELERSTVVELGPEPATPRERDEERYRDAERHPKRRVPDRGRHR